LLAKLRRQYFSCCNKWET